MLKARDVWNEQEERRERRMAAMRPVLAQLYAKIRAQAIHNANAPYPDGFWVPGVARQ